MAEDFIPTHRAKVDPPPEVRVVIYDPERGHIAVAPADRTEREMDGRGGTLLQGQEKTPVAVHKGNAIIEYSGHIYAVMPADNVSAWFEPIDNRRALPGRSRRNDETLPERDPKVPE